MAAKVIVIFFPISTSELALRQTDLNFQPQLKPTFMNPTAVVTTSISGKMYEGMISVVSYFAIEYTSNWNWHLEDLGSLIPTVSP
ncbi:hypothetical protein V7S43_009630 [Phytophthora oleae]|uniref:GST N-terminal domain-containing protein n=1 Tax=Phytophthora oleae TaxID=2107226 RepID=A0ABD3FH43_9STRA